MDLIKALHWRYATKRFDTERIVSEDKILRLKRTFNLTATSYGLQPLRLVVVQDKPLQEKLRAAAFNQQQVSTASHVLVITIEREVGKEFIESYFRSVHHIRKTPKEILNPYTESLVKRFEKASPKEIREWAVNQAYLSLGSLLTACAVEQIDSCPMEGFDPQQFDEILGLKQQNLESILVLPVGYRAPDDKFAEFKKVRRPLEEMVIRRP